MIGQMYAQSASLEKIMRKAVTMAHLGRRGQPAPEPGVQITHRISLPGTAKNRKPQTFEAGFIHGGPDAPSLVVIRLDNLEVFKAKVGPDFRNNPDRFKVESIANFPRDWRELFMAINLYRSGTAS